MFLCSEFIIGLKYFQIKYDVYKHMMFESNKNQIFWNAIRSDFIRCWHTEYWQHGLSKLWFQTVSLKGSDLITKPGFSALWTKSMIIRVTSKSVVLTLPQCLSSCADGSSAVPACHRSPRMSQCLHLSGSLHHHWGPPSNIKTYLLLILLGTSLELLICSLTALCPSLLHKMILSPHTPN